MENLCQSQRVHSLLNGDAGLALDTQQMSLLDTFQLVLQPLEHSISELL